MRDDWNYMSEGEKIGRINAAEDRYRRDERAIQRLSVGQSVKTPDGWTGVIAEKIPERSEVYVESWEKGGTYGASEVTPTTGTDVTGGL